jgi:hypothetical protein
MITLTVFAVFKAVEVPDVDEELIDEDEDELDKTMINACVRVARTNKEIYRRFLRQDPDTNDDINTPRGSCGCCIHTLCCVDGLWMLSAVPL